MIPDSFLLFLFACLVIELTPGPNMAYLVVLSLTLGKRIGLITVAGIATGLLCIGILAALGITALVTASPTILTVIHGSGVIYLIWLAWQSWWDDGELSPEHTDDKSHMRYFRRGFIVNILNPKAFLFYVTVLPEFIQSTEHVALSTLLLTLVSVIIATLIHSLIVLLAARMQVFVTHSSQRKTIRRISSLLLLLLAIWLAALL